MIVTLIEKNKDIIQTINTDNIPRIGETMLLTHESNARIKYTVTDVIHVYLKDQTPQIMIELDWA